MTSWLLRTENDVKSRLAVNQDNTIVISIEDNHLKTSQTAQFVCFLTSTVFTEIQTWYQIQPSYKSLVNLPKTLQLQRYSTDSHHPTAQMCLSNRVSRKQGSTINYHAGGSRDRDISCVCKHSCRDQHWTSDIRGHNGNDGRHEKCYQTSCDAI